MKKWLFVFKRLYNIGLVKYIILPALTAWVSMMYLTQPRLGSETLTFKVGETGMMVTLHVMPGIDEYELYVYESNEKENPSKMTRLIGTGVSVDDADLLFFDNKNNDTLFIANFSSTPIELKIANKGNRTIKVVDKTDNSFLLNRLYFTEKKNESGRTDEILKQGYVGIYLSANSCRASLEDITDLNYSDLIPVSVKRSLFCREVQF